MAMHDLHATVLDLPFELHCEIVSYAPLGTQIIYETQLCRTLRTLFGPRLCVSRPQSFRLVEWRKASLDVARSSAEAAHEEDEFAREPDNLHLHLGKQTRSIWDTSPSSTPKPAPAPCYTTANPAIPPRLGLKHLDVPVQRALAFPALDVGVAHSELITPHSDDANVQLLVRCMRVFGQGERDRDAAQSPLPPLRLYTPSADQPLRSLSLLSRTGFRVAALSYLLHALPVLRMVETVLMTSAGYVDSLLWFAYASHLDITSSGDGPLPSTTTTPSCLETQAIVIPGPLAQRGRGLQSGFRCFCFDIQSSKPTAVAAPATFHVIFHDWYDEQEAEGVQNMLENSEITCNACKRAIRF